MPESPLIQREMDIAASIHAVTEEIMLRAAKYVYSQTGMRNLVLAGSYINLGCEALHLGQVRLIGMADPDLKA